VFLQTGRVRSEKHWQRTIVPSLYQFSCAEVVTIVFPSTKNFTLPRSLPEPQGSDNCFPTLETIGGFNLNAPKSSKSSKLSSVLIGFSIINY
jgi:hypothetical protein